MGEIDYLAIGIITILNTTITIIVSTIVKEIIDWFKKKKEDAKNYWKNLNLKNGNG